MPSGAAVSGSVSHALIDVLVETGTTVRVSLPAPASTVVWQTKGLIRGPGELLVTR
ncbi:hypothetical protein ABT154_33050 [Streptomyces sp. NPDC001728]|uniref:hypothetical protein n=1 Tax=Streptomyces sp. NPDC001728 TaxID=3154396 RepID=UPI0033198AA3